VQLDKKNTYLNEYTFNVNATINHHLPKISHQKPLLIRFISNPLFEINQLYITHKTTYWIEPDYTKSLYSCQVFLKISPNPWITSLKDYPVGLIRCSVENETLETPELYLE
jgi:hypothetical protein